MLSGKRRRASPFRFWRCSLGQRRSIRGPGPRARGVRGVDGAIAADAIGLPSRGSARKGQGSRIRTSLYGAWRRPRRQRRAGQCRYADRAIGLGGAWQGAGGPHPRRTTYRAVISGPAFPPALRMAAMAALQGRRRETGRELRLREVSRRIIFGGQTWQRNDLKLAVRLRRVAPVTNELHDAIRSHDELRNCRQAIGHYVGAASNPRFGKRFIDMYDLVS
jgi:hypothetical protein